LPCLESLYGHERSTCYIQFVNARLKSVPLEGLPNYVYANVVI
jgi:hypothetical protein